MKIAFIRVKTVSYTNVVALKHIKREEIVTFRWHALLKNMFAFKLPIAMILIPVYRCIYIQSGITILKLVEFKSDPSKTPFF